MVTWIVCGMPILTIKKECWQIVTWKIKDSRVQDLKPESQSSTRPKIETQSPKILDYKT